MCSVHPIAFSLVVSIGLVMSVNLLTKILTQVDTFDEELKKLVGMGFEKVFQALSF